MTSGSSGMRRPGTLCMSAVVAPELSRKASTRQATDKWALIEVPIGKCESGWWLSACASYG